MQAMKGVPNDNDDGGHHCGEGRRKMEKKKSPNSRREKLFRYYSIGF